MSAVIAFPEQIFDVQCWYSQLFLFEKVGAFKL